MELFWDADKHGRSLTWFLNLPSLSVFVRVQFFCDMAQIRVEAKLRLAVT